VCGSEMGNVFCRRILLALLGYLSKKEEPPLRNRGVLEFLTFLRAGVRYFLIFLLVLILVRSIELRSLHSILQYKICTTTDHCRPITTFV
jgi:hypothetical protein